MDAKQFAALADRIDVINNTLERFLVGQISRPEGFEALIMALTGPGFGGMPSSYSLTDAIGDSADKIASELGEVHCSIDRLTEAVDHLTASVVESSRIIAFEIAATGRTHIAPVL